MHNFSQYRIIINFLLKVFAIQVLKKKIDVVRFLFIQFISLPDCRNFVARFPPPITWKVIDEAHSHWKVFDLAQRVAEVDLEAQVRCTVILL